MDYICRKLTCEDISMVMDMNRDYREGFICRPNAEDFLADPENWIWAAVMNGQIIGFAYGYELHRLNNIGNMLYIHEVGVMDAYQRQGVGYTMMSMLKSECHSRGICRFFLTAYQNNIGANALYRKLGGAVSLESHGDDVVYYFNTK